MGEQVKRAAEVLREYAEMIYESGLHRSGPNKGRCDPPIEEEVAEYRSLAEALDRLGWIALAERLPDDDITVMIAMKDGTEPVWLGYYDGDCWYSVDATPIRTRVTHWRPMPEGPNG